MSLQLVKILVVDADDHPVESAAVALRSVDNSENFFSYTDVSGIAEFVVEEGKHIVSVSKTNYLSPSPLTVEAAPSPGATPAVFDSGTEAVIVGAVTISLAIGYPIDNVLPIEYGGTTLSELATAVNSALGYTAVDITSGRFVISTQETGALAGVRVVASGYEEGNLAVFGEAYTEDQEARGKDLPVDYNTFEVRLQKRGDLHASNPNHCVLWGRFYRNELSEPLRGATVQVEVYNGPYSRDVGVDVGDSFYATTDSDGYVVFELPRNIRARVYIPWIDKMIDLTVPDQSSCDLSTLLAPYATAVSIYSPVLPVNLAVGETTSVMLQLLMSDGSTKTAKPTSVTSDNSAVILPVGNVLTAVSTGTAGVIATYINTRNEVLTTEEFLVTVS